MQAKKKSKKVVKITKTKKETALKKKAADVPVRASIKRQVKRKQSYESYPVSLEEFEDMVESEFEDYEQTEMEVESAEEEEEEEEEEELEEENIQEVEKDTKTKKQDNFTDIVQVLSYVFPLHIDKEELVIDENPVKDVKSNNGREISFTAKYKQVDVLCIRIIIDGDINFHQEQYVYAYDMSQRLIACRNVANYLAFFQCERLEEVNFIKKPVLLLIKPLYSNGSLQQYLLQLKKTGVDHIPHIYVLQMAINLFSMLADAHAQNIGLVSINTDKLFVGDDYGLYFDGFEACISFDESDKAQGKFWMNPFGIRCPEFFKKPRQFKYFPGSDVYLASMVLIEIAKDFTYPARPFKLEKGVAMLKKEGIHKNHQTLIETIEKGLMANPKDRPTASAMLEELIEARSNFLQDTADI